MWGMVWSIVQGMCPMCGAMGPWMILVWLLVLALVVGVVWLVIRMIRRP